MKAEVVATPIVTVNGVTLPTSTAGRPPGQVLLDPATFTWGRADPLEQPTPATGQVLVFDATNRWATATRLTGAPVVVSVNLYAPLEQGDFTNTQTVIFRGRVGEGLTVTRHTMNWNGTRVEGTLVELPLRSLLVDLANIVPTVAWPAETLEARRARLAAACASVLPGGITVGSKWQAATVAAVAVAEQRPLLQHLSELYDSCGADRYAFDPTDQSLWPIRRRVVPGRSLGRLYRDPRPEAAPDATGAFIVTDTVPYVNNDFVLTRAWWDAARLVQDPAAGLAAPALITRVQVATPGGAVTEALVPGVSEAAVGIRTAGVTSQATDSAHITAAVADLQQFATVEAAQWTLAPITWAETINGPADYITNLMLLIGGTEESDGLFLQRTWLRTYGIRPVVAVIGGTVTYTGGGWQVTATVTPVVYTGKLHPISWPEVDDGTTTNRLKIYTDGLPHGDALHESVTCEDLMFVSCGLGVAAPGPDAGWDGTP